MRLPLALLVTCAAITAQVPTDTVLLLETPSSLTSPYYKLVSVFGYGNTTLRAQNTFLQVTSIATDPTNATRYFYQSGASSLAGTWQSDLGRLAVIGQNQWGPWSQTPASRLEVGLQQIFTLDAGNVFQVAKAGGTPAPLLSQQGAVDLAVVDPFVYVLSNDPNAPAPIVEYNLLTNASRTLTSIAGARSIAASPVTNELCVGLDNGDLVRIDRTTGNSNGATPTGLGPIVAVGYTRLGTIVYSDAVTLWSELAPTAPIYTSPTTILDFGIGLPPTASVVPFGEGCGLGQSWSWATNSLPHPGNANFQLGGRNLPGNHAALLTLGTNRTYASTLMAALPWDLAPLGAPGCMLLADPAAAIILLTNAAGETNMTIPIPLAGSLVGLEFSGQWWSSYNNTIALSEGVVFVIR